MATTAMAANCYGHNCCAMPGGIYYYAMPDGIYCYGEAYAYSCYTYGYTCGGTMRPSAQRAAGLVKAWLGSGLGVGEGPG